MRQPSEIQNTTEQAAQAIATLPVEKWTQWASYLLEARDSIADERGDRDEWDAQLEMFADDLATRLELGRW